MLVFTAEIVWLSWRWRPQNGLILVQQDLLFWLVAGLPVVSLLYAYGLDTHWQTSALIALKQMANGVFNTLLASLLVLVLQLRFGKSGFNAMPLISLRQLLFHVLITLTLVAGVVPLMLDAKKLEAEYQQSVVQRATLLANSLQKQLPAAIPQLLAGNNTALMNLLPDDATGFALLDHNGAVLSSAGVIKSLATTGVTLPAQGLTHWQPADILPRLQRWQQSRYLFVLPLSMPEQITAIAIEQKATDVITKLEQDSARQLLLLVSFFTAGCTVE